VISLTAVQYSLAFNSTNIHHFRDNFTGHRWPNQQCHSTEG